MLPQDHTRPGQGPLRHQGARHDAIYTGVNYRAVRKKEPDPWRELISFYRFHLWDPIYFRNDLRVELQQIGAGGVWPTETTDMEAQKAHFAKHGFIGPHIHPDPENPESVMSNWLYDRSDDYCSTVYWHQRPTGKPLPPMPSREERIADIEYRDWETLPQWDS